MAGGGRKGPDNTPIDRELTRAGAFGRYQVFLVFTVVTGIMSCNLLTHGIAILELEPTAYICVSAEFPQGYECTDPCGAEVTSYSVDYAAANENIYNWVTKLGLVCKPKSTTAHIALAAFVGVFLGVLFIPRLGDLIGRKPVFIACLIGSLPALIMVTFTTSPLVVTIGAFIAGPCIIARMSCGFLMLMEHMPQKH